MRPFLEVLDLRRLSQPVVPVEAVGHRHRLEGAFAQARGQIHRDLRQLPDATVAHQLARQPEQLVAPLLRAGLQDDVLLAHRLHQPLSFVDRQRQRLFRVDILVRRGGGEIDQRVPVIGRGIDDDVDVLAIEDAPEVGHLVGDLRVAGKLFRHRRGLVGIDIAERHHVAEPARALDVAAPHPAAPDQREPGTIVGARRGRRLRGCRELTLDEPSGQPGRRGNRGAVAEEGPP